ncbi:MAG: hypothetical protein NTX64_02360 [Elusimicrobia bacterium]|nr:hypothetical protein [Elusimicrobiota bacterium]
MTGTAKMEKPTRRWTAVLAAASLLLGSTHEALAQVAEVAAAPAGIQVPGAAGAATTAGSAASVSPLTLPSLSLSAPVLTPLTPSAGIQVAVTPAQPLAPLPSRTGEGEAAITLTPALSRTSGEGERTPVISRTAEAGETATALTPALSRTRERENGAIGTASGESKVTAVARRALGRFALPMPRLVAAFDGARVAAADAEAAPAAQLDPAKIKVFLTRAGQDPVATDLASLASELARNPDFLAEINRSGRVRMVVNAERPGALGKAQAEALRKALADQGVSARFDIESVAIDWRQGENKPVSAQAGAVTGARGVIAAAMSPFRELLYLGRTLRAAATRPTVAEVIGGVVSKGPAFVLSAMWWWKLFLPSHPVAFAVAMGASLALQVFHGVWINTWQNFQQILSRQRGINYQAAFNFMYMQSTTAVFRFISWTVDKKTVMPWQLKYWRDISFANIAGTFVGVLGFYGLNDLYEKGIIPRSGRSWIQQGRDLFFLLAGTFMFSGSMGAFWALFAVQQAMDLGLYFISRRMRARPALYVADASLAETDSFKSMYPVVPGPERSPVREALKALLDNPFVKPIVRLAKAIGKLLRRKAP